MEIVLFWIFLALAVCLLAKRFGRGLIIWFFIALIASPLIAIIFLLILGSTHKCPECKGGVDKDAKKCKHCGSELSA